MPTQSPLDSYLGTHAGILVFFLVIVAFLTINLILWKILRPVRASEEKLKDIFKLRSEIDADGKERYYMWPKEYIEHSIIALTQTSPTTLSGYTGASPSGRYLAPASGPDCVQYRGGQCSGTTANGRILTGPQYVKWDFSFVKRFSMGRNRFIEARMDLYNVFDNINFIPVAYSTGSSRSNWEVTSAARDVHASQDAGGRITQFDLRFTW